MTSGKQIKIEHIPFYLKAFSEITKNTNVKFAINHSCTMMIYCKFRI